MGPYDGIPVGEGDGNTIVSITYYDHAETPGLGAEVNNPRWQAQWEGKRFTAKRATSPEIHLTKGGASNEYEVDALSGATLTSNGVTNMLQFWLSEEGFAPYLAKFRSGTEPSDAEDTETDFDDVEGGLIMADVNAKGVLTAPIFKNNPIALQILGICSALAVTTSMSVSLVMSLAVIFVTSFRTCSYR
ncbi:hypothetical protein HAALTHF_41030n [Vreelandella aquamarina]|nr:hypothetical protein HAALTHF_41030n [Halomonas axialensis]